MSICDMFGYLVVGSLYVIVMGYALLIMWAIYKSVKEW
jgi:hypothetical protein